MKHITKAGVPHKYAVWRKTIKGNENEDYRNLQNPEKEILQNALLSEQGFLCGYTMRRIDPDSSHIEHIKPETLCRDDEKGSDLDYANMIACYPREGMKSKYRYGAQEKDNWWENNGRQFISPLDPRCETLISFNLRGEVSVKNGNAEASKTIKVLKLDHESLTEDRRRAIVEFIYGPTGYDPISQSSALTAIKEIANPLARGEFVEFCIAIKYALDEYVLTLRKVALKKKYSQQQKKKKK